MTKSLNKISIEGMYPKIVKKKKKKNSIYNIPTANILNGEKLKAFSLRSGVRHLLILYMKVLNKDTDRMKS